MNITDLIRRGYELNKQMVDLKEELDEIKSQIKAHAEESDAHDIEVDDIKVKISDCSISVPKQKAVNKLVALIIKKNMKSEMPNLLKINVSNTKKLFDKKTFDSLFNIEIKPFNAVKFFKKRNR